MPEEHHLTARNLLEQMNRQFNECNALYHELAVHYGVSDTVFWLLYTLYNSSEPQTQNRLCMEWNLPKQTSCRLTEEGKQAMEEYIENLKSYLNL